MFPLEQGAFEMLLIGAIALMVVGPKDLPVLMRKVGQFTAKMRGMAAEFRASFDELARQSELDDLRKEVEALRTGQLLTSESKSVDQHFDALHSEYTTPTAVDAPSYGELAPQIEAEPELFPELAPAHEPDLPLAPPATPELRKPRARKAAPEAAPISADGEPTLPKPRKTRAAKSPAPEPAPAEREA